MAKTLSDAQTSAILDASYALPPSDQKALRARVLARLEAEPEVGDGLVFRICRAAQRELWAPPLDGVDRSFRRAQQLRKFR
jgi:hypothetical protein